MTYKDKEKQKAADKERQRRYRLKKRDGLDMKGVTSQKGVTLSPDDAPQSTNADTKPDNRNTKSVTDVTVKESVTVPNAVKPLPDDIPKPISSRYARGDPEYNAMIDALINTSLAQLEADGVWVPVWRLKRREDAA